MSPEEEGLLFACCIHSWVEQYLVFQHQPQAHSCGIKEWTNLERRIRTERHRTAEGLSKKTQPRWNLLESQVQVRVLFIKT